MEIEQLYDMVKDLGEVEISTMVGAPCLRHKGEFFGMFMSSEESLIVKLPAKRVDEIIENEDGNPFNYTGKKFKEWVLIPLDFEDRYSDYLKEAFAFAAAKFA